MEDDIGLDASTKETAVSIRREGQRVWLGKWVTVPATISVLFRRRAPATKRVVFETGPLAVWLFHALSTMGVPMICIDVRQAKAALSMARNKPMQTTLTACGILPKSASTGQFV